MHLESRNRQHREKLIHDFEMGFDTIRKGFFLRGRLNFFFFRGDVFGLKGVYLTSYLAQGGVDFNQKYEQNINKKI